MDKQQWRRRRQQHREYHMPPAGAAVTKHHSHSTLSCVVGSTRRNATRKYARHLVLKKHKFISVQQQQQQQNDDDDDDEDYDWIELTLRRGGRRAEVKGWGVLCSQSHKEPSNAYTYIFIKTTKHTNIHFYIAKQVVWHNRTYMLTYGWYIRHYRQTDKHS